jgi:hypothetical protein
MRTGGSRESLRIRLEVESDLDNGGDVQVAGFHHHLVRPPGGGGHREHLRLTPRPDAHARFADPAHLTDAESQRSRVGLRLAPGLGGRLPARLGPGGVVEP